MLGRGRAPSADDEVAIGNVVARLVSAGLSVLDRDEPAKADLKLMARAYSVPLQVMRAVAVAIGSLVMR